MIRNMECVLSQPLNCPYGSAAAKPMDFGTAATMWIGKPPGKPQKNFPRLDVEDLQVSVHHRKSQVGQHCVEMCSKV